MKVPIRLSARAGASPCTCINLSVNMGTQALAQGWGREQDRWAHRLGSLMFQELPRQWGRQQQPRAENSQLRQVGNQVRSRGQGERWDSKAPRLDT